MARMRLILLALGAATAANAGNLSVPVIGAPPETLQPTTKPLQQPAPAATARTTASAATSPTKPAQQPASAPQSYNPYSAPASLSPQLQVKKPAPSPSQLPWNAQPATTNEKTVEVFGGQQNPQPGANQTVASAPVAAAKPPKPKLIYPKRAEGRPLYRISLAQPRATLTLYSGTCLAENKPELRQQMIDAGIDTRRKSVLHSVIASLPGGREKGCWYYDKEGKFFRVTLANGQGEDFAREQVDSIR